jgi:hypothetical protein
VNKLLVLHVERLRARALSSELEFILSRRQAVAIIICRRRRRQWRRNALGRVLRFLAELLALLLLLDELRRRDFDRDLLQQLLELIAALLVVHGLAALKVQLAVQVRVHEIVRLDVEGDAEGVVADDAERAERPDVRAARLGLQQHHLPHGERRHLVLPRLARGRRRLAVGALVEGGLGVAVDRGVLADGPALEASCGTAEHLLLFCSQRWKIFRITFFFPGFVFINFLESSFKILFFQISYFLLVLKKSK